MRMMLIVSPAMIVFMSISAPAGVTLYWVVGGVFSCLQTFITNVIMKPRLKAQVAEELKQNPPKQVVTPRKDVTESAAKPADNKQATKQIKQPKTVQTTKAATQEGSRSGNKIYDKNCRQIKNFFVLQFLLQLKKTFAFRGGMYNDVQIINV